MKTIIHQALCGEQNKAWDLIKTTLSNLPLAKRIAFQTDLQDSPPSGISWEPAIRGFLFGDHFLVIKTYPDYSPDVRNGRVFSHCLIIDKSDLNKITDLSPILSVFPESIDKGMELQPLTISIGKDSSVILDDLIQLRFNKVVKSFINFTNKRGSIIWVGQNQFSLAICKIWQMLSADQREELNFGINFNANEVAKDKLSFVTIPETTENKFINKGFVIVRKEDSTELTEFVDQFLAGQKDAIKRIDAFLSAIEAGALSTHDISIISKGISTYENLSKESDFKLLNTLSHIIAKYSPRENQGTVLKAKLLDRIILLLKTAEESDIYLLRNFQTKAFQKSEMKLSKAIIDWSESFLFNEKPNQKKDYTPFLNEIFGLSKLNWLSKTITNALTTFLASIQAAQAKILWIWIITDIDLLDKLESKIENTHIAERSLYENLPALPKEVDEKVRVVIMKRGWFRLYAAILKSNTDFFSALSDFLIANEGNEDGLDIITENINDKDIIEASTKITDNRLFQLSGKLCRRNSKLLENIKIENPNWQKIWLSAIEKGNNITDGLKNPSVTIYSLFDLLVQGRPINPDLISKIGETEYGNILHYTSRSKMWNKLPAASKEKYLQKTAAAFLETLSKDSRVEIVNDKDLTDYVTSKALTLFLSNNKNNIKAVLPIFYVYSKISENVLRNYINSFDGNIDVLSATQLGQLVASRRYEGVAASIYQKSKRQRQYRAALAECYGLLDFISRGIAWAGGWISKAAISEDDWWKAFIELSYTLYSSGPMDNKIWTQAGGKDFDLLTRGTGKEVWMSALEKLRRKEAAGEIRVKKLLNAMLEEHKKNETLKTLKNFWSKL